MWFASTRQLVLAVGPAWAKQILFTGDIFDAPTAPRIGQVDEDQTVRALYAASVTSADYAEGVRAFLEKRPAKFS